MFAAARHGPSANFAAAADVLRYRLLHKYEGIYLDTDDPLIKSIIDRDFLAHPKNVLLGALPDGTKNTANMNYIYNNSVFGSHPGNPVLQAVSEESYRRWQE